MTINSVLSLCQRMKYTKLSVKFVPKNTEKKTNWAVKN